MNESKTLLTRLQQADEEITQLKKEVASLKMESAIHSDRAAVLARQVTVKKALAVPVAMTKAQAVEAYAKLTDAKSKQAFRIAHARELGLKGI